MGRPAGGVCLASAPAHWNWTPLARAELGHSPEAPTPPLITGQSSSWAPSPYNQLLPGQSPGCPRHLRSPHIALHLSLLLTGSPLQPRHASLPPTAGDHPPRLFSPWPHAKVLSQTPLAHCRAGEPPREAPKSTWQQARGLLGPQSLFQPRQASSSEFAPGSACFGVPTDFEQKLSERTCCGVVCSVFESIKDRRKSGSRVPALN